jgi:hypothetical protein
MSAPPVSAERNPADINEGELRFLSEPPTAPVHLHDSRVTISAESLRSGWVENRQCHYRLDRVAALQVVFHPGRVRKLRVLRAENIGRAWVEGASVQLENVGADAVLCLASENRALRRRSDGAYEWHGGPYMRRFLDGYFPMQARVAIGYPADALRVASLEPAELRLGAVQQPGHLRVDALFEGRLEIAVVFAPTEMIERQDP